MLSCKDINQNADQYIDGELTIRQRLAVGFHLLMCVHCRRYVRQLAATINTLRQLPKKECSEVQMEQIIHRLLDKEENQDNL